MALPLLWGLAAGSPLGGLTASIGALNVAFSDQPLPYRLKAATMLSTSVSGAVSVAVGVLSGAWGWPAFAVTGLWGFGAGVLVALGPTATQIGLTNLVLMIVMAGLGLDPHEAPLQAALVFAGGLLQTAIALAPWPLRRLSLERARLAAVFRRLASYAREPSAAGGPPMGDVFSQARDVLYGAGASGSRTLETLRALLDQGERIRVELLAIAALRDRLAELQAVPGGTSVALARESIARVLRAAEVTLTVAAERLAAGSVGFRAVGSTRNAQRALEPLRQAVETGSASSGPQGLLLRELVARGDALAGQLRALGRIASSEEDVAAGAPAPSVPRHRAALPHPFTRLRAGLAILRANLTLRSTACRHGIRLAITLAVADALARALAIPHGYWVAMTAAIVLKPDFAATFERSIAREIGTLLGLGVATVLAIATAGTALSHVLLIVALTFAVRAIGPANYTLVVTCVTALVVVLLSLAGQPAAQTIAQRALGTLLGGAIALIAFVAWPTWERVQTPVVLAQMLEAYRRYANAVFAAYLDPKGAAPAELEESRRAARLARTNAEASIDRLRAEPTSTQRRAESDLYAGVLVNSHRFVYATLALEAHAASASRLYARDWVACFAVRVDAALSWLATRLRKGAEPEEPFPDLRGEQRRLARTPSPADPRHAHSAAFLVEEADVMTNSLNTLAHLLQR